MKLFYAKDELPGATTLSMTTGGTAVFGALGLVLSVPFLLSLRRRFDSWWAPTIGLVVFTVMFAVGVGHRPRHHRLRLLRTAQPAQPAQPLSQPGRSPRERPWRIMIAGVPVALHP